MSAEGKLSAKSSPLFSRSPKVGVSNRRYATRGKNIEISTSKLYYNLARPSGFSTLNKLATAVPKKNNSDVRAWLEKQDAFAHNRHHRHTSHSQTCEEAFRPQSIYCDYRDGLVGKRSAGRTVPRKTLICTDTFYQSSTFSRNFCICSS